jgi:hypothetical protein
MGPLSHMRLVVDRNVVMRRIPVDPLIFVRLGIISTEARCCTYVPYFSNASSFVKVDIIAKINLL